MSTLQTSFNTPILIGPSIGSGSVAINGGLAYGDFSVVIGSSSTAGGLEDIIVGGSSTTDATGNGIAIGNFVTSNNGGLVIGTSNSATGVNSVAIAGNATGNGSVCVKGQALGDQNISIGTNSNAGGTGPANNCVAIGSMATASGTSGQDNIWTIGHNTTNTVPGSMLLGGTANSVPLSLIWNDQTADLGTFSNHFGTLYVNNVTQIAPAGVTAYTASLGNQNITASTPALIVGALGGMTVLENPGSYFTFNNSPTSNPSLQYTGTVSRFFDVSFMVSYSSPGFATGENVQLYLVVNASPPSIPAPSDVACNFLGGTVGVTTKSDHSLRRIIQLNHNDKIWFAIQSDQTGTVTFNQCSITLTQI